MSHGVNSSESLARVGLFSLTGAMPYRAGRIDSSNLSPPPQRRGKSSKALVRSGGAGEDEKGGIGCICSSTFIVMYARDDGDEGGGGGGRTWRRGGRGQGGIRVAAGMDPLPLLFRKHILCIHACSTPG